MLVVTTSHLMFKCDVTKSVWEKIKYWQIFEPVLAADEVSSIVFLNLLELLISKRSTNVLYVLKEVVEIKE